MYTYQIRRKPEFLSSVPGPDLGGPWGPGPQASHQKGPPTILREIHFTTIITDFAAAKSRKVSGLWF